MSLGADRFDEFFQVLHGHGPFPWQRRLLDVVLAEGWPETLALPTASGKTACIDIAVFALASGRPNMPRRIFLVVDRRVIVDEAFERAQRIAERLSQATDGVLAEVAEALRKVAGHDEHPLAVFQLRGGVYRDDAWARTPAQPTVVCSTVDQIGSRLLFRSYGASPYAWPVHAGLAANDALILLDEAHCAEPFRQTLSAIARYRTLADRPVSAPFAHVVLSATPVASESSAPFCLDEEDRRHPVLLARLSAAKPTRLVEGKARTATAEFAKQLATEAMAFARAGASRIGIIVNRIANAKLVFEHLGDQGVASDRRALFMGRMRPWDRDRVLARWKTVFAADPDRARLEGPCFAVATQCLEVGANLDFDALVSECASLDALRQRFGRLFRLGRPQDGKERERVVATIVMPKPETRQFDPIYGEALASTWHWLNEHAEDGRIDFGIDAMDAMLPAPGGERAAYLAKLELVVPAVNAPVMLPAHVDAWAQTSPAPWPDPDPALFLHGPKAGMPDVHVCWRADLDSLPSDQWPAAIAMVPPTSAECMSVPLHLVRRWLNGEDLDDCGGDVQMPEEATGEASDVSIAEPRQALRWRGEDDALLVSRGATLRPGDTVVIPAGLGGWAGFGALALDDTGKPVALDVGDETHLKARLRPALRLLPALLDTWPASAALDELRTLVHPDTVEQREAEGTYRQDLVSVFRKVGDALGAARAEGSRDWSWLRIAIDALVSGRAGFEIERLDNHGIVVVGRRILGSVQRERLLGHAVRHNESFSSEDDSASFTVAVPLATHLQGVAEFAGRFAEACGLEASMIDDLRLAASVHDIGKADPRFQAWLRGGVPYPVAPPFESMLAKSAGASSAAARKRARVRAGYPQGGRHELLSLRLIESDAAATAQAGDAELVLHLVASHHGRCRPFAPVVADAEPQQVALTAGELRLQSSSDTGLERLDSGVAERFWALVRRYGWWGLAYLEAIHILSDHRRSEWEQTQGEQDR